jgi:hypothetical protein
MASPEGSSLLGTGMGLLDDAIREHLELKRQHGGDPSEIERQEREAFGAAARPAAPAEDEVASVEDERTVVAPPPEEEPVDADEAVRDEVRPATEEVPPPPNGRGVEDEEEVPPPPNGRGAGEEEDPWLVEETADPEPEPEEDVLEETPDFLQETPEHDRLWFEQKPPRDFDWDK